MDKEAAKVFEHDRFDLDDYADEELAEQKRLNRQVMLAMLSRLRSRNLVLLSFIWVKIGLPLHCSQREEEVYFSDLPLLKAIKGRKRMIVSNLRLVCEGLSSFT